MLDIARKTLLLLGLIHCAQALAADVPEVPLTLGDVTVDVMTHSDRNHLAAASLLAKETAGVDSSWSEVGLQLEFRDSSTLGRFREVRGFSLLTLAETKRSKLFLGMNKRGLLGLHFSSGQQSSNDRVLEIARLPFLNRIETLAELTQ